MNGLLGQKKGMTQIFSETGDSIPVTVVEAGPCPVLQRKSAEKDRYIALKLGFGEKKKKGKGLNYRFIREFRLTESAEGEGVEVVTAAIFKAGDRVHVTGQSKGKGFQGVMKRHGKAGGPASHGSRFHRSTGSIGQRTSPGEVFKNMKLPGHMGQERVTVRNLEVVEVRENLLFIKGAVPGNPNDFLILRKAS